MEQIEKLIGLPVVASEHGKHVDSFIAYIHILMFALFVGWLAYFIYVLFRFHHTRHPKADHVGVRSHASSYIEGLVVAIEAALLIFVAIPAWSKMVGENNYPKDSDATVIRLVAQQFGWNFRYPGKDGKFGRQDMRFVNADNIFGIDPSDEAGKDDFATLNEMRVPLGKPVLVHISSKDVIHSFKVVPFRVTQDAIPGLVIPIHFTPTQTGRYQITCAQLCGNGHYAMTQGYVFVDKPEDYQKWIESKQSGGGGATSFE